MKQLLSSLFVLILVSNAFALPRFAVMEEVNCSTCHSYQGGGAGRSSYGKDYIGESLVMKDFQFPWANEESEFPLYFGADTRYQIIAGQDEDIRHFPMQLALYAGAEIGNVIAHTEVNRILDEFRLTGGVRYEGLPLESWVSVGKELPIMGWRIDDHTVFTRGGNLSTVGLSREGMPYTPFIEPPTLLEIGAAPIVGLELSAMTGSSFINQNDTSDTGLFQAMKLAYTFSGESFTALAGLAYLQEGELTTSVLNWGLGIDKFVWLGEVSKLDAWPQPGQLNFAALQQLSYRLFQGLDLIGRYEFFDPESDLLSGSIQRTSFGIEVFPVSGVEIKLSYRRTQVDLPSAAPDPEGQFLSQIHFYL